jgi:hypothetical protein
MQKVNRKILFNIANVTFSIFSFKASVLVNKQIFSRLINLRWITGSSVLRKDTDMVDITDQSLPIPNYQHKENETIELRKQR